MSDYEDDLEVSTEPPTIDPYDVLDIEKDATPEEVRRAYRKAALKNHPDKASPDQQDKAHEAFQSIAFAYAVLSDPARRKRYDETGSTSESIVDSDGFNWSDYYREQFKDAVSTDAIEKFAKQYKGSDEEKDDILAAFELHEGDLDGVYEMVILSDVLEDDERFREIIDEAIENKEVPNFKVYNSESTKKRQQRLQKARKEAAKEAKEAEEYAKELGVHDKLYNNDSSQDKGKSKGKSKTSKDSSEDALAALIQKRQQDRSGAGFLDRIAEKYGATSTGKKGKKRASPPDEPPEEMFQAAEAKYRAKKGAESKSGPSSGKRARR